MNGLFLGIHALYLYIDNLWQYACEDQQQAI